MPVRVVHGANEGYFPVEGMTIGQVARQLKDMLNLPSNAEALVHGKEVDHHYRIADGESVEFVRNKGQKGGVLDYWSELEVIALFGADAVEEMRGMGIEPTLIPVFTNDQITSWQAKRVGRPEPSKHAY